MSNFDHENYPDGEWEDQDELVWNEFDWQRYLRRNEEEITNFLNFYEKVRKSENRLEQAAHLMGWGSYERSNSELESGDDYNPSEKIQEENEASSQEQEPYTFHKHPAFIVNRALCQSLHRHWELLLEQDSIGITPTSAWAYAKSLHHGEISANHAIQALDMGEYALAICHLKSALHALNEALKVLQQLPEEEFSKGEHLPEEALVRLFDLREIWLRLMQDCREELRNRFKDE